MMPLKNISRKSLLARLKLVFVSLATVAAITMCTGEAFAVGTLDPSFGINGEAQAAGVAFALQPDGKIVSVDYVGGPYAWDFAVMRYYSNGNPDITFGRKGRVITSVTPYSDFPTAVAIQPDGKIVVVGYAYSSGGPYAGSDFAIVRYNPNGSLDDSFGNGGIVVTYRTGVDQIHAVAIQFDGKILVAGRGSPPSSPCDTHYMVGRYTYNGALDLTFGKNGMVFSGFTSMYPPLCNFDTYGAYTSVSVTDDGKIIVGGGSYGNLDGYVVLAQYSAIGFLDYMYWYRNGREDALGGGFKFVQKLSDGKILAIGTKLARFESDGQLDPTFPPNSQLGTNSNLIHSGNGALFADGKIVHAQSYDTGSSTAINTRMFSSDGIVLGLATVPNSNNLVRGVLAQPDGKVIVISDKMRRYLSITN